MPNDAVLDAFNLVHIGEPRGGFGNKDGDYAKTVVWMREQKERRRKLTRKRKKKAGVGVDAPVKKKRKMVVAEEEDAAEADGMMGTIKRVRDHMLEGGKIYLVVEWEGYPRRKDWEKMLLNEVYEAAPLPTGHYMMEWLSRNADDATEETGDALRGFVRSTVQIMFGF